MHHSIEQGVSVRGWMEGNGFVQTIPCIMNKIGIFPVFYFNCVWIDAFSSHSLVVCPSHESFTLGIRVPAKQKLTQLKGPSSRLEYQGRTATVNVKVVKPGFLDEKRKVFRSNWINILFLACQPEWKASIYERMDSSPMGSTRYWLSMVFTLNRWHCAKPLRWIW